MCDKAHYEGLEDRVDAIDIRLTKMESEVMGMRNEMKEGFYDLKEQLGHIYAEKAEWNKWVRESIDLKAVGKWVGRWLLIVTFALIGLNHMGDFKKLFSSVPTVGAEVK